MTHHCVLNGSYRLLLQECHRRMYESQTSRTSHSAILQCCFRYKQILDVLQGTFISKHVGHEHMKSDDLIHYAI